ncbi:Meiosis protein 5 [Candida viswanathii]|uniref:Meiosis protein 5 n=1 Tax=Candida viswanathii TaxID=5486 RepID=A0A367Y140_9ASCO|nr:Meiosis protein 5 [Candida viswanathii]
MPVIHSTQTKHLSGKNGRKYKPLVAKNKSTSDHELKLDKQIRHWEIQRDTLSKAIRYKKESARVEQLIEKYTTVAQMASNYLYNEYSIKFTKIGGYKQWQLKQWEFKRQQLSGFDDEMQTVYMNYFESEEFAQLSELEKREIRLDYESKFEGEEEAEPPEFTDEFTMGDLYKILNLEYDLVYGA